jgi:hypothetical protein
VLPILFHFLAIVLGLLHLDAFEYLVVFFGNPQQFAQPLLSIQTVKQTYDFVAVQKLTLTIIVDAMRQTLWRAEIKVR